MEFFRNPNIDWLGQKWRFLGFSLIFSIAGILSMSFWHGVPLGVDFKGGTLVYVKFTQAPHEDTVRAATDKAGLKDARIQRYGDPRNNEILIGLEQRQTLDHPRSALPITELSEDHQTLLEKRMSIAVLRCATAGLAVISHAVRYLPMIIESDESLQRILIERDRRLELTFVAIEIRQVREEDCQSAGISNIAENIGALAVAFPSDAVRAAGPLDVSEILK